MAELLTFLAASCAGTGAFLLGWRLGSWLLSRF